MEVIVDVLGGKDLARMGDNDLSDPYCRIGVADSNGNFVDHRSTICSEVCLFCFVLFCFVLFCCVVFFYVLVESGSPLHNKSSMEPCIIRMVCLDA
jgi:hypothetical protein